MLGSYSLQLVTVGFDVQEFFTDFARIADDESRHFGWCVQRLRELGYEYGCMVAHDLLWQGAQCSSGASVSPITFIG